MKKLISYTLTLSMIAANVIPAYATTSDANAKKVLFETAQNTFDQLSSELYPADYLETYESTMTTFLTSLVETNTLTVNSSNTYNFYDETSDVNVNFTYNDDGESILINYALDYNDSIDSYSETGTFYIDDTKILYNDGNDDQPIVYNFGDSLDDPELEEYIEYLKYSNIKKYINLFLELETSGKLDDIVEDYVGNFLIYIAEADFTYENDTITMVIDDELVEEYLTQLVDKVKNDKNIKEIYDSLGIPFAYEDLFTEDTAIELIEFVDTMFGDVGESYEITYVGVIQNDLLTQNKLIFSNSSEDSVTFELNFNDVSNGVLSDSEFLIYDSADYLNLNTKYSLTDNNGEKTFVYEAKEGDTVFSKGNFAYTLDGLSSTSTGEMVSYSQPFYYITEEPVSTPLTKEEWYNSELSIYSTMITDLENELVFVKDQLNNIRNSTGTVDFDVNNDYSYKLYYIGYNVDFEVSDAISLEDGTVLDKDRAIELLNVWVGEINSELEYYTEYIDDLKLTVDEQYATYLEDFEMYYQYELEEYNKYLDYIANGSPLDALRQVMYAESVLSAEKLAAKQNQEVYENDNLLTKSYVEYELQKSTTKNTINTDNAISLKDYISQY